MRQHFEETVKPGKKIITDGKIKAFFRRTSFMETFSFRFGLEITKRFSECVTQQTYMLKQHLYLPFIYCNWLWTLNRGTTVYEYIFSRNLLIY